MKSAVFYLLIALIMVIWTWQLKLIKICMHKQKKNLGTYIDSFLILYYKITRGLASKILILSRAGIELVWTGLVWFENSPNNLKFFLFQLDMTDMFYMVTCGPFPTRVQMAKEKKKHFKKSPCNTATCTLYHPDFKNA